MCFLCTNSQSILQKLTKHRVFASGMIISTVAGLWACGGTGALPLRVPQPRPLSYTLEAWLPASRRPSHHATHTTVSRTHNGGQVAGTEEHISSPQMRKRSLG